MDNPDLLRATEMLLVAAKYIREHCPDQLIHYDDVDCDGFCVADDCESAAAALGFDDGFDEES